MQQVLPVLMLSFVQFAQIRHSKVYCIASPLMLLAGDAESSWAIWVVFLMLTFLHIYANVRAVCALQLTTLNRSRMDVLLESCSACKVALAPLGQRNLN